MDTSRVDGVKAPQHRGTPRSNWSAVSCDWSFMLRNFRPCQSSGFRILSSEAHSRSSFVQDLGCLKRQFPANSGSKPSGPTFLRSTSSWGSLWNRFMSFQTPRSCRVNLSKVHAATRSNLRDAWPRLMDTS